MSPSFRLLLCGQSVFVLYSLLRGRPVGRCDTACSIPVLCIAVHLLAWATDGNSSDLQKEVVFIVTKLTFLL